MRKLSLIVGLAVIFIVSAASKSDSPHGPGFKVPCEKCHSSKGWKLDKEIYSFDHNTTKMPLVGQHQAVDCRSCHVSLVFSEAKTECIDCHTDMHNQTVGPDCGRCHTPKSWIVNDISGLHQRSRFPLLGAHTTAACNQCHPSASLLRFEPLGVECINCHQKDYNGATEPNHIQSNYSTNCTDCHTMNAFSWTGNINHDFFPLKEGHSGVDCFSCHSQGTYTGLSTACVSCHQANYDATANPNHASLGFSTECNLCHTLAKGWRPAKYSDHDAQFFPIYSGKHNGTWAMCTDCHPNSSNYLEYTCTTEACHPQGKTDGEHGEVGGYSYNSPACLSCHPQGSGEGSFNHNNSAFPLTGAHITTPCNQCHVTQYAGTPTGCPDCHLPNYNATTNPNHAQISLPTSCADCHTTNPGWKPALFTIHSTYYQLTGAHTTVDCNSCHNGQYSNTPNTCVGCHQDNYNATNNPNHTQINIPTTCADCHTTNPGWKPASFAIHETYYPLTGAHTSVDCNSCHNGNYSNTPNTCVGCHLANYNGTTNPNHTNAGIGTTCADCHTTNPGWTPATFSQHNTIWPLTGAHTSVDCNSCHNGNYNNTPNTCVGCHLNDYNSTNNPPHASAQFPQTCESCHTTSAWVPSTFNHDGQYFPIYSGKHNGEWNLCSDCHPNPGNYAEFTCTTACHPQTQMNEDHSGVSGYSYNSNACLNCHPNGSAPQMMRPRINPKQN